MKRAPVAYNLPRGTHLPDFRRERRLLRVSDYKDLFARSRVLFIWHVDRWESGDLGKTTTLHGSGGDTVRWGCLRKSEALQALDLVRLNDLKNLFSGSPTIVSFGGSQQLPQTSRIGSLDAFDELYQHYRAMRSPHRHLVGGMIDGEILTHEQLERVMKNSPRAQLAGIANAVAPVSILRSIRSPAAALATTAARHVDKLAPSSGSHTDDGGSRDKVTP